MLMLCRVGCRSSASAAPGAVSRPPRARRVAGGAGGAACRVNYNCAGFRLPAA